MQLIPTILCANDFAACPGYRQFRDCLLLVESSCDCHLGPAKSRCVRSRISLCGEVLISSKPVLSQLTVFAGTVNPYPAMPFRRRIRLHSRTQTSAPAGISYRMATLTPSHPDPQRGFGALWAEYLYVDESHRLPRYLTLTRSLTASGTMVRVIWARAAIDLEKLDKAAAGVWKGT